MQAGAGPMEPAPVTPVAAKKRESKKEFRQQKAEGKQKTEGKQSAKSREQREVSTESNNK